MIKVKDTKRLKAFGFTELDDPFHGDKMYGKPLSVTNGNLDYRIIVFGDRTLVLTPEFGSRKDDEDIANAEYPNVPLDDIFDLQAAGLLERVNGDE